MAQAPPTWEEAVKAIPSPHNQHFKQSSARLEGDQLVISLAPTANLAAVTHQLGPMIERAVKAVYGQAVTFQVEQQAPPEGPVVEDDPPSLPKTGIKTQGFTPVVDSLAQQLGLIPAAIYGVIWRYCQMNSHTCYASQTAIAERLGLNRRTVIRNLEPLEDGGYIRCLNPNARLQGETKVYIVTNKVEIEATFTLTATEQE